MVLTTTSAFAESDQDGFRREISAALRDGDTDAMARASCRQPPRSVVVGTARHAFPMNHATIGPPPTYRPDGSKAVLKQMRVYEGAEFAINLCFKPGESKQMCLLAPVKRGDGKLCID